MKGSSGEFGSSSDLQEGSLSPGSRASESSVHTIFWKQTDGLSRLGRRRQRLKAERQKYLDAAPESRRLTWPGVARGGRPWLRGHRPGLRDACVTAAEQLRRRAAPAFGAAFSEEHERRLPGSRRGQSGTGSVLRRERPMPKWGVLGAFTLLEGCLRALALWLPPRKLALCWTSLKRPLSW